MRNRRKLSEISAPWLAGRFSIAREDARTTRAQDTIAAPLDHDARQATASRPARDSRYLAPNDKVAEPTSWFLVAAPAALR
jgi:hypothetical protein